MKAMRNEVKRVLELSVVIAFFIYVWNVVGVSEMPESSFDRYGEGWTFSYNGKEKVIDIPVRQKVDAGDTYEISHVVSWELPFNVRLLYRSLQQEVEIYVDETLIYKYPSEDYIAGLTPNHWNMVELPEDVEGKLLTIRLNSEYEQFSGKIGELYLGEYPVLYSYVRGKYFLQLLVGLVVGVVGSLIILAGSLVYEKRSYYAEISLGLLFIFTSFWMCGEAKIPFANVSSLTQYFLVFSSLLLIPALFYLYVYFRMKGRNKKISLKIFWLNFTVFSFCLILQLTGIRDYPAMLPFIHGTIAIVFLCGIFIMGRELYRKSGIFTVQECILVILFLASMGTEMIRFYLDQYQLLEIYIRMTMLCYALSVLFGIGVKIYHTEKENRMLARMLQESKSALMISQIQPHFIYNTLNSIRTLIRIEPDRAYDMVYDFAKYLRAHIDSLSNEKEVIFFRELEYIESYVNIEKVRFGERLRVEFDIQTTDFYLPSLSIQPLVENAIKHGICKRPEGGTVWIRSYEDKEQEGGYVVEVEDDGVGFDVEQWDNAKGVKKSAGINNIRFRVEAISNARLFIESEINKGTKATIIFPDGGAEHRQ